MSLVAILVAGVASAQAAGPECDAMTPVGVEEVCNGVDDDCDGAIDERMGTTTCGTGPCVNTVENCIKGEPQTCTPKPAPSSTETCGNGIDDNCNGEKDEDCQAGCIPDWSWSAWGSCVSGSQTRTAIDLNNCPPGLVAPPADQTQACQSTTCNPVTSPCTVGVGACASSGTQTQSCVNGVLGAPTPCSATPGNPGYENCGNYVDDDCDGQTDEGCLKQVGQPCQTNAQCYSQNCVNGVCALYQDCINACTSPATQNCYSYSCGFFGFSTCQQCYPQGPSLNQACAYACQHTCVPVTTPCTVGLGACARSGTQTQSCSLYDTLNASTPCSVTPGTPILEVCGNGVDDDCDGNLDNGCPAPCSGTITCGNGACINTVPACVNGVPQTCTPGNPNPEVCGNHVDDNCDGWTDEGCLNYNGQSCQGGYQCYSQNCVNGLCGSYQDCVNSCYFSVQNCGWHTCYGSGPFSSSYQCYQCNTYYYTNSSCVNACHP